MNLSCVRRRRVGDPHRRGIGLTLCKVKWYFRFLEPVPQFMLTQGGQLLSRFVVKVKELWGSITTEPKRRRCQKMAAMAVTSSGRGILMFNPFICNPEAFNLWLLWYRIFWASFDLFISRVARYTPSSQIKIHPKICDPALTEIGERALR